MIIDSEIVMAKVVGALVIGIVALVGTLFWHKSKKIDIPQDTLQKSFLWGSFYGFFFAETIITVAIMSVVFFINGLFKRDFRGLLKPYIKALPWAVVILTIVSFMGNNVS